MLGFILAVAPRPKVLLLDEPAANLDVVARREILDDILDSGNTMRLVLPVLREMGAASVKSCVLLRKDREAARSIPRSCW